MLCRADAEAALSQLVRALDVPDLRAAAAASVPARQERLKPFRAEWIGRLAAAEGVRSLAPDGSTPTPAFVLATLREAVAARTPSRGERVLWVNEATSNLPLVWSHLRPERAGSMVGSGASGLGYALGASIGAVLGGVVARRDFDLVATVVGDGTFLFGVPATAFWLAKRQKTVSVPASPRAFTS